MIISVCTPTYNREDYLKVLYKSLELQSNKSFEWLIIDDGSSDNTESLIKELKKEASFNITYDKQKNQGKHKAINEGVKLAHGHLFFIVDSDDRLPPKAIETILNKYATVSNVPECAGVVGLKCYFNGKTVGSPPLGEDILCSNIDYRYKMNIKGDRAEIFKTEIIKKYPFPIFPGEKFIPEGIVWNRIALKYNLLFFNENIYECEYLVGGLSSNSIRLRRTNPLGITTHYKELASVPGLEWIQKSKAIINYWRFYLCMDYKFKDFIKSKANPSEWIVLLPIGLLLYLKDSLLVVSQKKFKTR